MSGNLDHALLCLKTRIFLSPRIILVYENIYSMACITTSLMVYWKTNWDTETRELNHMGHLILIKWHAPEIILNLRKLAECIHDTMYSPIVAQSQYDYAFLSEKSHQCHSTHQLLIYLSFIRVPIYRLACTKQ